MGSLNFPQFPFPTFDLDPVLLRRDDLVLGVLLVLGLHHLELAGQVHPQLKAAGADLGKGGNKLSGMSRNRL